MLTCDIFCRVIDNFGDIGVSWRLAHQLASEFQVVVRLVVDDMASVHKLVPAVDAGLPEQRVGGVTVVAWRDDMNLMTIADLVIEAFACSPPAAYVQRMAEATRKPVWINLEYLSAESWIEGHHLLPSPHPGLPLVKYFYFPGFTAGTGGLIREKNLIALRDSAMAIDARDGLRVLIFGYDHAPVEALFAAIAKMRESVVCNVSEGALAAKLKHWRGSQGKNAPEGATVREFNLIPFVPQSEFDSLLWRHDILFVRGEDSFVRAQWAARPFIWHLYPQSEGAHLAKMRAFLDLYCDSLPVPVATVVRDLWLAWNVANTDAIGPAWFAFVAQRSALDAHARRWTKRLLEMPDLASSLLSFYGKNVKI